MKKRGGVLSLGAILSAVLVFFGVYFYVVEVAPVKIRSINSENIIENNYTADSLTVKCLEHTPTVTFAIAGDVMLDRSVWHSFKDKGLTKIFEDFDQTIFTDKDFALLNLEGPISSEPINDDWKSGSMVFNFPPESTDVLNHLGIDVISLANNHSQNAGIKGLSYTREILDDEKIKYFGSQDSFNWDNVVRLNTEIPITLIGINTLPEFENGDIINVIKSEKEDGQFVIVMPHWGNEYQSVHNSHQENWAKSWIFAGADAIIGSHPHVVQDVEIIDNVPVVYSLGNFVFDQMFSKETQEGLIITGELTDEKLVLNFVPTIQKKIYVDEMTETNSSKLISNILKIESNSIELTR